MTVAEQIRDCAMRFAAHAATTHNLPTEAQPALVATFLSAMNVTVQFLAANDGNPLCTPQALSHAVDEAAKSAGLPVHGT